MASVQQVPYMHSTDQCFHVKHREYIGDILSSVNFQVWGPGSVSGAAIDTGYRINPEAAGTFPWLSGIAGSFEQYEFTGMAFEYVPTCGDALSSTDNALGTVIMSINYNSVDAVAGSKQAMMEQMWSVSGKPSEHKLMPVECKNAQNPVNKLYTAATLPAGYDPRLYDLGFLQVATQGMQQNNINVGELWVTYDVKLYKPQSNSLVANAGAHYYSATAVSATNFATAFLKQDYDAIGVTISGNTLEFNTPGLYQITMTASTNTAYFGTSTFTAIGAVGINLFQNKTLSAYHAESVNSVEVLTVQVNVPSALLSFTPTIPGTPAFYDLLITALAE